MMYQTEGNDIVSPADRGVFVPGESVSELVDRALTQLQSGRGDIDVTISELGHRSQASRRLTDIWRSTDDSGLKWATVFLASQLAQPSAVPFLIEASAAAGSDEYSESASRIAGATLISMVEAEGRLRHHGAEPSTGRWIQPSNAAASA